MKDISALKTKAEAYDKIEETNLQILTDKLAKIEDENLKSLIETSNLSTVEKIAKIDAFNVQPVQAQQPVTPAPIRATNANSKGSPEALQNPLYNPNR